MRCDVLCHFVWGVLFLSPVQPAHQSYFFTVPVCLFVFVAAGECERRAQGGEGGAEEAERRTA